MEVSDHPHKGELYIVSIKKLLHSEAVLRSLKIMLTFVIIPYIHVLSYDLCNSVDREYCTFLKVCPKMTNLVL